MDVTYTYSKVNINSYRIEIAIHISQLLKIINFRDVENQSYLPKFALGLFQRSVHPWPTKERLALKFFHQKVCGRIIKQRERLFPSSLNFVRSKQLLGPGGGGGQFWPHSSRCAGLWNDVGVGKRWQRANTLFNHITFNKGLFWQYCLWTPTLLYKLAWKLAALQTARQAFTSTGKWDL